MLKHFRELFRLNLGKIWKATLASGLVAMLLSVFLLRAMPIYESSVTLNMQPSIEELQFNSVFLGVSQFNPATIITQTHIERLLSKPVAGRAIDILISQNDGQLPVDPPTIFERFKAQAFVWFRILNSGYFVELPERDIFITDLIGSTSIESVAGSYILLLEVSYTDPDIAAAAANALAQAYIEQTQEDFRADAERVAETLNAVQAEFENRLVGLLAERRGLERELGISSISTERTYRLESRSLARAALEEADVNALEQATQLDALVAALATEGDATVVRQLRQNLVDARAALAAAEVNQAQRRDNLAEAERALRELDEAEKSFVSVEQRILETETDLAELQERRVQTILAREARLSQIRIVSPATPAVYPKSPRVLINTVVGLIVGMILTLVPIIARDALGERINTSEDLRSSFGPRTLPTMSGAILKSAKSYLESGEPPKQNLKTYAEEVGRRLAVDGLQAWPEEQLDITTYNITDRSNELAVLMRAVIKILDHKNSAGTLLSVEVLPAVSQFESWKDAENHHIIIGFQQGEAGHSDLENISLPKASYGIMMA